MSGEKICLSLDHMYSIRDVIEKAADKVGGIEKIEKDGVLVQVCGDKRAFDSFAHEISEAGSRERRDMRTALGRREYMERRVVLLEAFWQSAHSALSY